MIYNFNTIEALSNGAINSRKHRERINLNLVQKRNPDLFMTELSVCYYTRLRQFTSEIVLIGRSRDYLCIIISKFDAPFDAFPLSLRWFDKKSSVVTIKLVKNRNKYRRVCNNYRRKLKVPKSILVVWRLPYYLQIHIKQYY